jgi:hypothetical protein
MTLRQRDFLCVWGRCVEISRVVDTSLSDPGGEWVFELTREKISDLKSGRVYDEGCG